MLFDEGQIDTISGTCFILESKKCAKRVTWLYVLFATTLSANNEATDVNVS